MSELSDLQASQSGLNGKYLVRRSDGEDKPGHPYHGAKLFVLDLTNDPIARYAAQVYASGVASVNPNLAHDIEAVLDTIAEVGP